MFGLPLALPKTVSLNIQLCSPKKALYIILAEHMVVNAFAESFE